MSGWEREEIPDQDRLFMRVHINTWVRNDEVLPGAFDNRPAGAAGMSTDWERYSTPEETRERGRNPWRQAVIEFLVGDARALPGQTVEHRPQDDNRAHTEVVGEKSEKVRVKFTRIWKWAIQPQASPSA